MSTVISEIDQDLQQIIDHSFHITKELLNEKGVFHPFGMTINLNGALIPFTFELEEGEEVDAEQIVDELDAVLNEQLENGEITAYGVGYEVQIEINENGDLSNALLIDLTHSQDNQVPFYFFPYTISEGKAVFGESFGIEK